MFGSNRAYEINRRNVCCMRKQQLTAATAIMQHIQRLMLVDFCAGPLKSTANSANTATAGRR